MKSKSLEKKTVSASSSENIKTKLNKYIEEGQHLLQLIKQKTLNKYQSLVPDKKKWEMGVVQFLQAVFEKNNIAAAFKRHGDYATPFTSLSTFSNAYSPEYSIRQREAQSQEKASFLNAMEMQISYLTNLLDNLELHKQEFNSKEANASNKSIFIVHGQNHQLKVEIARAIEKLKLTPVILHEQSSQGRTIIEKFEGYADNAQFAIVLLTDDDIGYSKIIPDDKKPRARQNVIFELGYFLGKLGRERVCALYSDGVELPSDYAGIVYVLLDAAGAWKLAMAKEMKAAGIAIDANDLIDP